MTFTSIDLKDVKNIVIVMSGKGGVGKSFVSATLAIALRELGLSIGIFDVDIHGPSVPWILGAEDRFMGLSINGKLIPPEINGIAIASFELLLEHRESPIVWRGPMKTRAIIEIMSKIRWGQRDFVIVDMPPGIGDEHLTIIHILRPWIKGAILVSTPSKLVEHIVKKTKKFLDNINVKLLGLVLNMAYFQCTNCGLIHKLYGDHIYIDTTIIEIPLDPKISHAIDNRRLLEYLSTDGKELLKKFIELCKIAIVKNT